MMSTDPCLELAASITRAASKQTYFTIRLLADRDRVPDAYRAYAYFRWVDDTLDAPNASLDERQEFLQRQQSLLADCYSHQIPDDPLPQEELLIALVSHDPDRRSSLHTYLSHMMMVMDFDTERRGRLISGFELNEYTRYLASAVTEALHYFVGHGCAAPRGESRYLAVSAAHITHMLRDTVEDVQAGYYNVPLEILERSRLSPGDIQAASYREWVKGRVELARRYFAVGRDYLRRVSNPRYRLACLAYISRFEGVLDSIEREGYLLRASYPERKTLGAMAHAALSIASSFIDRHEEYLSTSQTSAREESPR
jgi:phytoene/squalene synthetase